MVEQLLLPFGDAFEAVSPATPTPPPAAMPKQTADLQTDASEPIDATDVVTSGWIATTLKQPLHRVKRVLKSRPDLQPIAYAGRTRLYRSSIVARVRHELNAIDARLAWQKEARR